MLAYLKLGLALAVAGACFASGYKVADWRASSTISAMKQKQAELVAANHRTEAMWSAHVIKLGDEANAENDRLRAAAARADAAARSLHDAGSRHAAAAASAPGTSEAAAAAILLHSDVRRRAVETLRELGPYADAARAAGATCVRADEVTR